MLFTIALPALWHWGINYYSDKLPGNYWEITGYFLINLPYRAFFGNVVIFN